MVLASIEGIPPLKKSHVQILKGLVRVWLANTYVEYLMSKSKFFFFFF